MTAEKRPPNPARRAYHPRGQGVVAKALPYLLEQVANSTLPDAPPLQPEEVACLLPMPLDVFARDGQPIKVRVPWLDVTIWMVPTDRDAPALIAEGIHRAGSGRPPS